MAHVSGSTDHRLPKRKRNPEASQSQLQLRRSKRTRQPQLRQAFEYDTLDKQKRLIRLFEPLPGEENDPLRGRLTTVDLDTGPDYDALSYAWGDPAHRFTLTLDGDKSLGITENLRNALVGLRDQHHSRTL